MRILLSYHYFKKVDLDDFMSRFPEPPEVFADSGAYSAYSVGASLHVEEYGRWLKRWRHHLHIRANLDVIQNPVATAQNQKHLEDMGVDPLPVFHGASPWDALHEMCEQYDFIAIGGLVSFKAGDQMPWLIRAHQIMKQHGTVAHGFGQMRLEWNRVLPWFTVDSSSWGAAYRFGTFALWDNRTKGWAKVKLRDKNSIYKNARLIRELGEDPDFLMTAGPDNPNRNAKMERARLARMSAMAWQQFEAYLQQRHRVPPPPGYEGDAGTRVYLALPETRNSSSIDGLNAVGTRVYLADGQPELLLMGAGVNNGSKTKSVDKPGRTRRKRASKR